MATKIDKQYIRDLQAGRIKTSVPTKYVYAEHDGAKVAHKMRPRKKGVAVERVEERAREIQWSAITAAMETKMSIEEEQRRARSEAFWARVSAAIKTQGV